MAELTTTDKVAALPLVEEQLVVSKTEVETARVRISIHVDERTEQVRDALRRSDVEVRRIPINQIVDVEPPIREEGGVTIYPIIEEILVKRLLVREELHITRTSTLEPVERDVTLRATRADVERILLNPKS